MAVKRTSSSAPSQRTPYTLRKKSEHGKVVKYENADKVNFYCPKDALPTPYPATITLIVEAGS